MRIGDASLRSKVKAVVGKTQVATYSNEILKVTGTFLATTVFVGLQIHLTIVW
jgi:hypothetical protein